MFSSFFLVSLSQKNRKYHKPLLSSIKEKRIDIIDNLCYFNPIMEIKKYFWVFNLIFIVIAAYFSASIVNNFVSYKIKPLPSAAKKTFNDRGTSISAGKVKKEYTHIRKHMLI